LQSTPSSADAAAPRHLSRVALIGLIVASVAIPAGVLAWILARNHSSSAPSPVVPSPHRATIGEPAPDFTLPNLDGQKVRLSQFRGKVVVLTFFASWCNPCQHDMPVLQKLQDQSGGRLAVMGVNYQDAINDTRRMVRDLHVTFPTLVEDAANNPVAKVYDVHAMPDTLFIDTSGVVRDRLWGETSTDDLSAPVNRLLSR